jgi:hypothetical protein
MLIDDALVRDFPTAISLSSITLANHGTIRPSAIQWIRIKGHPVRQVATQGIKSPTPQLLKLWPITRAPARKPKPASRKDQKREHRQHLKRERRITNSLPQLPSARPSRRRVSPGLLKQQERVLNRVLREIEKPQDESTERFEVSMAKDD